MSNIVLSVEATEVLMTNIINSLRYYIGRLEGKILVTDGTGTNPDRDKLIARCKALCQLGNDVIHCTDFDKDKEQFVDTFDALALVVVEAESICGVG